MDKVADNVNPEVFDVAGARESSGKEYDEDFVDEFDQREIFDLIRNIKDPEHPLTLEQLHVVEEHRINIDNKGNSIHINFTPTIPHCSMATLIGLSIRVLLLRALPYR